MHEKSRVFGELDEKLTNSNLNTKTGPPATMFHWSFFKRVHICKMFSCPRKATRCCGASSALVCLLIFRLVRLRSVLWSWMRDILLRIRIRGFLPLTTGSGSGSDPRPSRRQQKTLGFLCFSAYYFLKLPYIYIILQR
jgi:hypothetical protein